MQIKTAPSREETRFKHDPETTSLGTGPFQVGRGKVENCPVDWQNQNLTFVLEITDVHLGPPGLLSVHSLKPSIHDGLGMHYWPWHGVAYTYGKAALMLNCIYRFLEQHMLTSRHRLFQGRLCIFQQDKFKPYSAQVTTARLHSRRVLVLNWPVCSPNLSPTENMWPSMKWQIRQLRTWTAEQLKSYIRQEWNKISLSQIQKLVSLAPHVDRVLLKEQVM